MSDGGYYLNDAKNKESVCLKSKDDWLKLQMATYTPGGKFHFMLIFFLFLQCDYKFT